MAVFLLAGQLALRAITSPSTAFRATSAGVVVSVLMLCLFCQTVVILLVHARAPGYLAAPFVHSLQDRIEDPAQLASAVRAHVWQRGQRVALGQGAVMLYDTALLALFWFGVGKLLRIAGVNLQDVLTVIVVAGVVSTVSVVARYLVALSIEADPGPFTLAGLGRLASSDRLALALSRVDVAKLWWALVAGAGFSRAWHRPKLMMQAITIAITAVWIVSVAHGH